MQPGRIPSGRKYGTELREGAVTSITSSSGNALLAAVSLTRSKRMIGSKQTNTNAIYDDKTQYANFRGKPLFEATKQRINNR